MRQRKFRVWEPVNKTMRTMKHCFYGGTGDSKRFVLPADDQGTQRSYTMMNLDAVKVMEYLGYKDICESDVISFRTFDGIGYIGSIEYNNDELCYEVNTTDSYAPCLFLLRDVIDFDSIVVIGNIYEGVDGKPWQL